MPDPGNHTKMAGLSFNPMELGNMCLAQVRPILDLTFCFYYSCPLATELLLSEGSHWLDLFASSAWPRPP
jgi:hypothetical protein